MRTDKRQDDSEVAGQDSFLDVVANIVGILILLVMVVGLRAGRESLDQGPGPTKVIPEISSEEVEQAQRAALEARARLAGLIEETRATRREAQQVDAERVDLATYVAAAKEEIDEKKQRLSQSQRRDLELREQLNTAQVRLEELAREQVSLTMMDSQVESIESLPTPLAQTVSGKELHIRLAGGLAKVIPLDQLLDDFRADAQSNLWRFESRNVVTMTVGPIEGFRLRYTLAKANYTRRSGSSATLIQLQRWQLLPDASAAGDPVSEAIQADSRLMRAVAARPPGSTTITVWTYPDSFDEFRELKRALYERGYATAGRPLPEGVLIGGSPNGAQSAAQ